MFYRHETFRSDSGRHRSLPYELVGGPQPEGLRGWNDGSATVAPDVNTSACTSRGRGPLLDYVNWSHLVKQSRHLTKQAIKSANCITFRVKSGIAYAIFDLTRKVVIIISDTLILLLRGIVSFEFRSRATHLAGCLSKCNERCFWHYWTTVSVIGGAAMQKYIYILKPYIVRNSYCWSIVI